MSLLLDAGGLPVTAPSLDLSEQQMLDVTRDPFMVTPPIDATTFANWRARLRKVSPHHDQVSYLHLVWEPGWAWEPVGRFMLFDCIPILSVDTEFIKDLQGPDPSDLTMYDAITGQITQKTLVTAMQWKIYRETGRYARPFWVIQGSSGGHKVFLSDVEKKLLTLNGYPDNFPAPGELPYAPFDNRVIDHIVRYDKLRKADGNVKRMAQIGATGNDLRSQALRQQLVAWLGGQMEEATGDLVTLLRRQKDQGRSPVVTPESVINERTEEYIAHGRMSDIR